MAMRPARTAKIARKAADEAPAAKSAPAMEPSGTAISHSFKSFRSTASRFRWAKSERSEVGTMIAIEVPTAKCMATLSGTSSH